MYASSTRLVSEHLLLNFSGLAAASLDASQLAVYRHTHVLTEARSQLYVMMQSHLVLTSM